MLPTWAVILLFLFGFVLSVLLSILIAKIISPVFVQRLDKYNQLSDDIKEIKEILHNEIYKK